MDKFISNKKNLKKKVFNEFENNWQLHWKDMPEFVSNKFSCYHELTIRFASEEDLKDFSKIINQIITKKTKSIWYPKLNRGSDIRNRKISTDKIYDNK